MLLPTLLLPPKRLLTPRFALQVLTLRRWSATGGFGSYPGGTCTRWFSTAFITQHPTTLAVGRCRI